MIVKTYAIINQTKEKINLVHKKEIKRKRIKNRLMIILSEKIIVTEESQYIYQSIYISCVLIYNRWNIM